MFKKLLLCTVILVSLLYGSGYDFASIRDLITDSSSHNARTMTGNNQGWG